MQLENEINLEDIMAQSMEECLCSLAKDNEATKPSSDLISPASRGSVYDWGWVAFYDFFYKLRVEMTPEFHFFKDTITTSGIFDWMFLPNIVITCEHPLYVKWVSNKETITKDLHSEDSPVLEWSDGYKIYALNGIKVPEYLVMTPPEELSIDFFLKETNADVRKEFITKYGIENMTSEGVLLDSYENYTDEFYHKSEYQLYNMINLFPEAEEEKALYLKMKHQTVGGYCLEGVSNNCETITDALGDRMTREGYPRKDFSKFKIIDIK